MSTWRHPDAYRHDDDPISCCPMEPWQNMLIATIEEAQAGDAAALEALLILAPDKVPQNTTVVGALHGV